MKEVLGVITLFYITFYAIKGNILMYRDIAPIEANYHQGCAKHGTTLKSYDKYTVTCESGITFSTNIDWSEQ